MRNRIFRIIEISEGDDLASSIYDYSMMMVIVISLIPLAFKTTNAVFVLIDRLAVVAFITDYFLRLLTADLKLKKAPHPLSYILLRLSPLSTSYASCRPSRLWHPVFAC